ncbi:hypothetical protein RGF97_09655 [Streptomyces roseicoloratus]|uniref:Lipoprotein n=1 Tax=Streptomyces roseicoloratus TaxID=2508722 RepID=A0ABY9RSB9_9ACTN|nr:hypothetical protein [Streptomyces roseicoloratus]WMX45066.1 hypothetical protein RGF97_09655 [Streptomyces roseicoloratus]
MSPRRRARLSAATVTATAAVPVAALGALALVLTGVLTGCGGHGELQSSGRTPSAVGPVRLWPDLPPATNPPLDYGETDTERVPGIGVPDNDVHAVDAIAVVQAEVRADPSARSGGNGLYEETARAIENCREGAAGRAACPVLKPYYRDLTGNGRDELIVGVRLPEQQLAVRVYLAENGGLTRIMSTVDQVVSIELAGRDLIMRVSSAGIPGYEYRTAWSWDEQQGAMLPARDEIIRVKPGPRASMVPAPQLVSPTATTAPAAPTPHPSEAAP